MSEVLSGLPERADREELGDGSAYFARADGGLVVPVGDAGAMAEAILWLAKRREAMARMGKLNRRRVEEEYVWEKNVEILLELYEALLPEGASEENGPIGDDYRRDGHGDE